MTIARYTYVEDEKEYTVLSMRKMDGYAHKKVLNLHDVSVDEVVQLLEDDLKNNNHHSEGFMYELLLGCMRDVMFDEVGLTDVHIKMIIWEIAQNGGLF